MSEIPIDIEETKVEKKIVKEETEKDQVERIHLAKVDTLEDVPGIGPVGEANLNKFGIFSKFDVIVQGQLVLIEATGMEKDKASKAIEYCRTVLEEHKLLAPRKETAYDILLKRRDIDKIKTGSKELDGIIGGGVDCKSITEISGAFHSGKTQISLNLVLNALQDVSKGGLQKKGEPPVRAMWIDTEKTMRPERLVQMAIERKIIKDDENEIKDLASRIEIFTPHDPAHLILILNNIVHVVREMNVRVIVIDSGAALFRQYMPAMGQKGGKSVLMNNMVRLLSMLAWVHNIAVIYTNQVYESVDQWNPGLRAFGGHVIGHAMTYRLTVKKQGKRWIATAEDYPHMPPDDAEFVITEKGIEDFTKKAKKKKSEDEND